MVSPNKCVCNIGLLNQFLFLFNYQIAQKMTVKQRTITIFHCFCRLSSSPLVFENRLIFTVYLVNLDNLRLETGFCLDALQKKNGWEAFFATTSCLNGGHCSPIKLRRWKRLKLVQGAYESSIRLPASLLGVGSFILTMQNGTNCVNTDWIHWK